MQILFVASRFPYPPIQGDRARGYNQLRILARRHSVTLLTPAPETDEDARLEAIRPFCERIEVVTTPHWRRLWRLTQAPFTSIPLQTLYSFDHRFRRKVLELHQEAPFDLVHVQLARMAPAIDGLENIPKVLDLIDALSLNMTRRALREHGPMAWTIALEAKRMQDYERELTQQYDQLFVSSILDREAIGDYDNLHVVPNGVNLEAHSFVPDNRESNMIIFTGRMKYFPNADAVMWFANRVLPLVRHQIADVRFVVVGAEPTRAVKKLTRQPGIIVTGYVPSIQDYLARTTIAVAPLQAGSGMQLKILEAMACGAPVVATPYALGGIKVEDGKHLLVAQDPLVFAEKVVCLLKDAMLRVHIARNARRLVEGKYTWERTVAALERIYHLAMT